MIGFGGVNLVANFVMVILSKKFTHFRMLDNEGRSIDFQFDNIGFVLFAMVKIVSGILMII
jgi:hypothetical protein